MALPEETNLDRRFSGNKAYKVLHIWERHHQIIRLIAQGLRNKDIAEHLGITKETVSNVRNSPIVRKRIQFLQSVMYKEVVDVQRRIVDIAPEAQAVLENLMHSGETSPLLRATIADKMLDRAGFVAPQRRQVEIVHGYFTKEYLEDLKGKAKEVGREVGMVVEVEAEISCESS